MSGVTAKIASMSSNDASTNIVIKDVGAGRMVEVKNANTGLVVGSCFIANGTDNALISVVSQSNPFRGEISVASRNSVYNIWTSKIFDNIYHGDSFVVIANTSYNPPVLRGYYQGHEDRIPKLMRYSQFEREINAGHDVDFG